MQYSVLRNEVGGTLKKPYYIKINIAVLLACLHPDWVKVLGTGEFITLIVSAILYFGVYWTSFISDKRRDGNGSLAGGYEMV